MLIEQIGRRDYSPEAIKVQFIYLKFNESKGNESKEMQLFSEYDREEKRRVSNGGRKKKCRMNCLRRD